MNSNEFSNQFDILVASYKRFKDFDNMEILDSIEFDEYEKSLYLTKAQEEIVLSLYNGHHIFRDSFDETEELKRYLSELILEATIVPTNNTGFIGIHKNSKFFALPNNLWFITYEAATISDAKCENMATIEVIPVTQDEYHRIKKNPFRGFNDRRALRLDLARNYVELVSDHTITSYYIRYIKKLKPIILVDLPDDVTIEGRNVITECEVHQSLHQRILELAVQMALQSKGIVMRQSQNENK